jgi:hypothetical protein
VVAYCLKITNIDPLMYNLLLSVSESGSCHYILISILMMKAAVAIMDYVIRNTVRNK